MSEPVWRPLVPTGREDVLAKGFPGHLREAMFEWIKQALDMPAYNLVNPSTFLDFQNAMHDDFGFKSDKYLAWDSDALVWLRKIDDDLYVNFLDYLVQRQGISGIWGRHPFEQVLTHPIEQVLSEGGSAWAVQPFNGGYRVMERVSQGVCDVVNEVLSSADRASSKLKQAWADAYGVNPRPSEAYSNAVVAVEIAALSCIKIEPKNGTEPTLSSLFSILEAENPKWRLVLRDSPKAPGAKSLATMLRTLWRGHESRHGRQDYTDASIEEARAAVMLAATLVQWFNTGVIQPVGGEGQTQT